MKRCAQPDPARMVQHIARLHHMDASMIAYLLDADPARVERWLAGVEAAPASAPRDLLGAARAVAQGRPPRRPLPARAGGRPRIRFRYRGPAP